MGIELQMLAWTIVLGLVHLFLDATMKTSERGLAWNASARDGEARPLGPVAGRVNRATPTDTKTELQPSAQA